MSEMDIGLALPAIEDERWQLATQIGVERAVVHPSMSTAEGRRGETPWDYDGLVRMHNAFQDTGLDVAVVEGGWPLTDVTRLGKDGRDEELSQICDFVRAVGAAGIPTICYSWMTNFWWVRTTATRRTRGGSLTTAYDDDEWQAGPPPEDAPVSEDRLWDTLEHFLERVGPVAEEAGVNLALHPDDPPLSPSRGVARIARSVGAYERIMDLYDDPVNGICFCQGNFAAMGADIPETIRRFGDRIHFTHFRDVDGGPEHFTETWQDDGPTDMLSAMEAYDDIDFEGVLRPDHVPSMVGESNDRPGYHTKGRLFAVGYMRGLLEQVDS